MNHIIQYLTSDKIISGIVFLIAIFFQEAIKEIVHSLKVGVGFKSNISLALFRDKKIDEIIRSFVDSHDDVDSAVLFKITNGGGVPKEGSPLNSMITHPTEKKIEWPITEVSPFFRGMYQKVYAEKRVTLDINDIPKNEPYYDYLKTQKGDILTVRKVMVKEERKCRYIFSVRLLCCTEEFESNNRLKEDIRRNVDLIKKIIQ